MPLRIIPALLLLWTPEAAPSTRTEVEAAAAAGRNPRYQDCIERVFENIREGRAHAERWAVEGGGPAAVHCLAIADLAAGFPKIAAVRLFELAERPDASDEGVRAKLYAEAAAQQPQEGAAGPADKGGEGDVVDAEFEEVDDADRRK